MYMIYINFTNGRTGYYAGLSNYDSWRGKYLTVSFNPDPSRAEKFPTYNSALSHAKWLKSNYDCVGYIEVV